MLRPKTLLLGFLALAAAIGAGFLAQNWLAAQRAHFEAALAARQTEAPEPRPAVEVLVAAESLPTGSFLKPEHVDWVAFPDAAVPDSYILRNAFEEGQLDGAVARQPLAAGEPITQPKLVRPGDRGFLAAVLAPGMRAVSVPINATTGISGFVFPGDSVDLLVTVSLDVAGRERRASQTVLRAVRVLAVDQRTNDQEGEPELAKTATLEVAPKEAEVIAVAMTMGVLSLSLRALAQEIPEEEEELAPETAIARLAALETAAGPGAAEETVPSLTWDDEATLFFHRGRTPPKADAPAPPPPIEVSIVRGGAREVKSFKGAGW
ncbi:MAG: Flp pilus assembly protein CpaB [Marivibrio sp.]|uniref:Flp pilus assembly protein CpaB n=1 Tax=Marivibrio sp. TaxID=2039719 RepID=UPI0032EF4DFB